MALVVAIQPDPEQAEHVSAVCRRIGADLVLAPTVAEVLVALRSRVPDLVLSPPFLSAGDEAALARRLQQLGSAAQHVQTIVMPVLGESVAKEQPPASNFEGFWWQRARPATPPPEACVPDTFAEQLSSYLRRARSERDEVEFSDMFPLSADAANGFDPPRADEFVAPQADEFRASPAEELDPLLAYEFAMPAASELDPAPSRPFVARQADESAAQSTNTFQTADAAIDLSPLLDAVIAETARQTERKARPAPKPKRRKIVDDGEALFDPARCSFATLVDAFDDFTTA